jgi:ABC-type multidrug transport system fused ATPase/permease subunit
MKKIINFYRDLIFVSRVTNTSNKKIRILFSVAASNLVVLLDLLIIIIFSFVIEQTINQNLLIKQFTNYSSENKWVLPVIVFLRFFFQYIDRMNLEILKLNVQENLRTYFIREVFDKGNYSVADAFFYVNTLSIHVSTFYGSLAAVFSFIVQIIVFSCYLIFSNTSVVGIFGLGALILYFPTKYFVKKLRKYSHLSYESLQDINKNVEKVLDNLYLIKILKKIEYEINEYNLTQNKFFNSQVMNLRYGTINSILPNFITIFLLSAVLIFFDFNSILTLEFIGVLLRLFQTLSNFNRSLSITTNSHVHLERLHKIDKNKGLSNKQNFVLDFSSEESQQTDLAVEFNSVSFRYFNSETEIFQNLNLKIKKNTHTVITGQNGSGKSTLLGLLSGVFYPTNGKVNSFSKEIAYIGAKPMIFHSTLRENLIYGVKNNIEEKELLKNLQKFEVFSEDTMMTLDTKISNKSLSSGQMQKISFIRALLINPDLLLLDESTANLDIKSKKLIFKILSELNLTIINSTHNLSDFIDYDEHYEVLITPDGRMLLKN